MHLTGTRYHRMRAVPAGLVAAVLVWAVVGCGGALAADWSQWRGPNRDGVTSEAVPWLGGVPKVCWRAEVGEGYSSLVVASGRAYTMGWSDGKDTVWCFDADTGRVLWNRAYPCQKGSSPGTRCTPTVQSGAVYVTSREGLVLCLGAADGHIRWSRDLYETLGGGPPKYGYACSPLWVDGRVVLEAGAPGAAMVGLDARDGSVLWRSGEEAGGYSSPVTFEVGGRRRVAALTGSALLGLDPADGRILWRYPREAWTRNAAPSPVVFGDRLFVSSGYGGGSVVLEPGDGGAVVLWADKDYRNLYSTSVYWDGYLYGFDGDRLHGGVLKCLDALSGQVQWSQKGFGKGQLIVAGGRLLILSDDGELVVADPSPARFREQGRVRVFSGRCWTTPAVSDGRILVRSRAGQVVCLGPAGR